MAVAHSTKVLNQQNLMELIKKQSENEFKGFAKDPRTGEWTWKHLVKQQAKQNGLPSVMDKFRR